MWTQITAVLNDYTFQVVALGTGMLGLISGVVGTYVTLRKESLLGDALSHSALPGIGIGFLLIQRKEFVVLLLGAVVSGLMATGLIQLMSKKSPVKFDSALYDYNNKYVNVAKHIINPKLSKKITDDLKKSSIKAHNSMGCNCVSRVDFRYDEKKKKYIS